MKKTKLNICFYNPNTREETADYIAKIFITVNKDKVETILHEEIEQSKEKNV